MQRLFLCIIILLISGCIKSQDASQAIEPATMIGITDTINVENDGLAAVGSLCFLTNGDMAVLDNVRRVIHVYREGEHFTSISSIGEGPMEYTAPLEISPATDGGFILNCPGDMKLIFYNSNYQSSHEITFNQFDLRPGTPVRIAMINPDEIVAQNYFFNGMNDCGTSVSLWDISDPEAPSRKHLIRSRSTSHFHPIEYLMNTRLAFSVFPDEELICIAEVTTENYRIDFLTPENDLLSSINDVTQRAVQKTSEELEAETSRVRQAWIRGTGSDTGFQYEPNECNFIITALNFDPQGRLWVRKSSPAVLEYDLYGDDLSRTGQYTIETPDDYMNDGWMVAFGDSVIAVTAINPEIGQLIYTADLKGL